MFNLITLGYSGLEQSKFVELAHNFQVDVVCDVRSVPYSRRRPEFSRSSFKRALNAANIKYAFFGDMLGARPNDRNCYIGNVAHYDRIAKSDPFQEGLARIREGVTKTNIALVCSERDPLECHRAILVCRHLPDLRDITAHIHTDGRLESQHDFEERLISFHRTAPPPLLRSTEEHVTGLREAYRLQGEAIAYSEPVPDGVFSL